MPKLMLLIYLLVLPLKVLTGQAIFAEQVALAFGSDQELVNGIQYSNNFIHFDGHPYFMDGKFRSGTVYTNNQVYDRTMIRYNLYTQKVEIMYWTVDNKLKFFMSVAELMPTFSLEGKEFIRRQFPEDLPAYYQVIRSGERVFYIGWKKKLKLSRSDSSREYQFSAPIISYWLEQDRQLSSFHNRKSFMDTFPESRKKEVSRLLKEQKFSFKHASSAEVEKMLKAALGLYQMEPMK